MVVRRGSERILEADVLQERFERVLRAHKSSLRAVLKASGSVWLALLECWDLLRWAYLC